LKKLLTLLIFTFIYSGIFAQEKSDDPRLIQFSGLIVTESEDAEEIIPLPYTNVAILGTHRGTYSEMDGFFSIVTEIGDTVVFSRIGYKTVEFIIQDTMQSNFYSWYQMMSKDSVLLPEAVIYPWPSREHYKIEFLALDVSSEMRERAKANLAEEILEQMTFAVPADGNEAFDLTTKQNIYNYQYSGQYKPQNIFNPIAWAKFIKAWKEGDFKRKDKKE